MRILAFILALVFCASSKAQVIYVDADATGANSGSSWNDAFPDLQNALATAIGGDEIWVAEGTYKPTNTTDRTISFVLVDGVALYGGFDGTESMRDERDWTIHESILSGDIGLPDDEDDNSFHVVIGSGVALSTVLDGFIVERGKASSDTAPHDRGGGILVLSGGPTVRNSTFRDNLAVDGGVQRGGGGYLENSSVAIENCVFQSNGAFGGALYVDGGDPLIRESQFIDNVTGAIIFINGAQSVIEDTVFDNNVGSGVFIESSNPIFRRVTFRNQSSCSGCDGGAVRIDGDSGPYFEDSFFEDNSSGSSASGGAVYIDDSARPIFVRTTFRGNTSGSAGGAISSRQVNGFTLIIDCVFERNTALSASAVLLSDAHGAIINSTFVGNKTTFADRGGALLITSPSASVDGILIANSIFVGNTGDKGGGLRLTSIGSTDVQIVNTTIAYNEASIEGGGVYSRDFGRRLQRHGLRM